VSTTADAGVAVASIEVPACVVCAASIASTTEEALLANILLHLLGKIDIDTSSKRVIGTR